MDVDGSGTWQPVILNNQLQAGFIPAVEAPTSA